MKNKLKQTEVNKIPKGWKIVEIRNIGEVVTGTTPSTKIEKFWGTGVPFVTPTDFTISKYVHKTERNVTLEGADQGRLVPNEAVMVTCIASVGEVAMASSECITNQQINTIICNNEINPDYIYYTIVFRKNDLKRWAGITTSPIIKKSMFEKFPITLPPLPEQQKIAEILSTVDEAIEKVDQAIEKIERLKKGLMQELLTKGIGHKEFKDTEIGKIPREWEVSKLCERLSLEYGKGLTEIQRLEGKYPVLGSNGIVGYHNDFLIKGPGIIVGRKGTIGAINWSNDNFWPIDTTYYVKLRDRRTDLRWLYYKLISLNLSKLNMATGTPGLNRDLAYSKVLSIPAHSEQHKIVEILDTVVSRLDLCNDKKQKLGKIKKGLMNDLLTGKRRVRV